MSLGLEELSQEAVSQILLENIEIYCINDQRVKHAWFNVECDESLALCVDIMQQEVTECEDQIEEMMRHLHS